MTGLRCEFRRAPHFGGFRERMRHPLLLDMAVHHFDLARMLAGLDARRAWARATNPLGSPFAHGAAATCVFELEGGVPFAYDGSWCAEGPPTSWNGDWRVQCAGGAALLVGDDVAFAERATGGGFERARELIALPAIDLPHTGFRASLRSFLAAVRGDEPTPPTECRDNVRSLAMVLAAVASADAGVEVAVEA